MKGKIGIIDIGSTSITLVIMMIRPNGSYYMVDQSKEYVRLSKGLSESGSMHETEIKEALHCIELFKKLCYSHDVKKILAVATAAVRTSANSMEFIKRIKKETCIDIEIISGEREAYLGYIGVINSMKLKDFVLIDVGGGSSEISLIKDGKFAEGISIPIGSMNLTERFRLDKIVDTKELDSYVSNKIQKIDWIDKSNGLPLIALGGSARTLAKIDKKQKRNILEGVHNYYVENNKAKEIYNKLSMLSPLRRKEIKGVKQKRADIIVGGLAPIINLLKLIKSDGIYISGHGLREGIFYEYYWSNVKQNKDMKTKNVVLHSIENILLNYNHNIQHSMNVEKISLQLFDQLKKLHKIDSEYKIVLQTASLLHDIGRNINYYNHHMHSFYMILNTRLHGLTNREKVMAAYLAGYHDFSTFKKTFANFGRVLKTGDDIIIKKLAIFLQIAEILDRSKTGLVKSVKCSMEQNVVRLKIITKEEFINFEAIALENTKKSFWKIYKKKLIYNL